MLRSPPFYIVFLTFSVYVGFFNAFSSLLNQILYPYGFSEDEAGICGAVLIVVGLVVAAVTSPILDRTHAYLLGIKIMCPLVAGSYLAMIWAPSSAMTRAAQEGAEAQCPRHIFQIQINMHRSLRKT